jgi:NhaP-type Na+/H+ or K+/H+ antiporter/mannitol/fructose-specific phosphotransferase system IIA component (Ntr-type)
MPESAWLKPIRGRRAHPNLKVDSPWGGGASGRYRICPRQGSRWFHAEGMGSPLILLSTVAAAVPGGKGHDVLLTLAVALAAGAFLIVLAKRLKIPAIVLLLFGGVLLGPEGWNIVQPDTLGGVLNVLVALAVGLILFEGGLTLNPAGYRAAGGVIRRLLSLGMVVTWAGTATAIFFLYGFDPTFCILAGSLVIVTGPTVIQPILKRTRLSPNLHHTLHWEGVLIDPVGVFAAVLAFEWVVGGGSELALSNLGLRILGGLTIGFLGGQLSCVLLRRRLIPDDMLNVFIIGVAVLTFGVTEALISEGGLLSATVAGLIIGARQPPALKEIVAFKSIITDLLIGFVFILLTARLELNQFIEFWPLGFILVAIVILVVRPLSVALCTFRSEFSLRERVFLGWIAPRGVVAASMASLFALSLTGTARGADGEPAFLESFVYSVIFVTVVLQGFSAGPLAALLKVRRKEPEGWLIVGAHPVGRAVASFLRDVRGVPVALIDGNRGAVLEAQQEGQVALFGDAREIDALEERPELRGVGRLLAFTDNEDLNELLCKKWEPTFGSDRVFRWASTKSLSGTATGTVLWSWMPKPSMVSSELVLGEAAMVELEGPRLKKPGGLAALLTAHTDEVLIDPGPHSQLRTASPATRTLYLQREADYLLQALRPEWLIRVANADKEAVFSALVEAVATTYPHLDASALRAEIVARDATLPTSLGHGVAIPHARLQDLPAPLCVIAQLQPPVVFHESDSEPVSLAFLLLSPISQPEMHLAILGEIARLAADPGVRSQLRDALAPDEMFGIIRRYRRQHTPFADARG